MGTVGLSFGSPTSGAGFDVSTTVSEIVSNLQNVETPWKTQLSSLESQDTVISSLGTLFSNLSNDMSSLTDLAGIMAQKEGSSSDQSVLQLTAASSTAVAGTYTVSVSNLATTSSGYLAPLASSSTQLTAGSSITLQVGSGAAQTFTVSSSDNTLAELAAAINSSGTGITANVLTDASGSRLSLASGTSGANGNITVSNNTLSAATAATLTSTVTPGSSSTTSSATFSPVASLSDALSGSLTIQVGSGTGVPVNLSDVNTAEGGTTLSDLESYINANSSTLGVSASITTNSDGTSSLQLTSLTAGSAGTLTVNSSLSDPATALNYTASVSGQNANLTVNGVALTSASNTVANLIPGVTFQLLAPSATESDGSLEQVQVVIANDNTGVESAVSSLVSDFNAAISAVNAQEGNTSSGTAEPLFGSPTLTLLQQQLLSSLNTQNPNGYLSAVPASSGTTLSGSITIQVGSNTGQTINVPTTSGDNTLTGLMNAINAADIGVTAGISTRSGESTLTLTSQTDGSSGALTVTSNVVASTPASLSYTDTTPYTATTADSGTLGTVAAAGDTLAGSVTIQVGNGTMQTITLDSSDNTLAGLAQAINNAALGVTAAVNTAGTAITLTSGTVGSAGALTVNSQLFDESNATTGDLAYTNSSNVNNLTDLGISVNNDGTLTLDATSLDSLLTTDYSGVVAFFQNANSWGQNFSTVLNDAGTSSPTGILSLASQSNSNIESTLNAKISQENSLISAEQSSLTAELNSANEIMQELPTQLQGINELYSAITGYNQSANG
ncbi:MAG: flagellar filament capping protein FliD [Terracidiphilus sp.]